MPKMLLGAGQILQMAMLGLQNGLGYVYHVWQMSPLQQGLRNYQLPA